MVRRQRVGVLRSVTAVAVYLYRSNDNLIFTAVCGEWRISCFYRGTFTMVTLPRRPLKKTLFNRNYFAQRHVDTSTCYGKMRTAYHACITTTCKGVNIPATETDNCFGSISKGGSFDWILWKYRLLPLLKNLVGDGDRGESWISAAAKKTTATGDHEQQQRKKRVYEAENSESTSCSAASYTNNRTIDSSVGLDPLPVLLARKSAKYRLDAGHHPKVSLGRCASYVP